jgi:histidinol dehydrogenase
VEIWRTEDPQTAGRLAALRRTLSIDAGLVRGSGAEGEPPLESVRRIVADVRARGDQAVAEYTRRFDGVSLAPDQFRVTAELIEAAHAAADGEFLAAARRSIANVRRFAEHIRPAPPAELTDGGRRMGIRFVPLAAVGVCAPGGRAAYPSSVIMTVAPAQVAGVKRIVLVSPPAVEGGVHPVILAVCRELGVEHVYRIGGAQAVAAMAFGTATLPKVDKIVGPGNLFVTLAKREVYGYVDIDSLAGPSEVVVIADAAADPRLVAAELLCQAEHDPGSAILFTPSGALAEAVADQIDRQLGTLSRQDALRESLAKFSALVVTADLVEAIRLTDEFAPEHLSVMTADPRAVMQQVRNAGTTFLGAFTPVAVGDYRAGPSHVLPTGGSARFAAGLSVTDFLRQTSHIEYDEPSLAADAADVVKLAELEGLDAHAASIRRRLEP